MRGKLLSLFVTVAAGLALGGCSGDAVTGPEPAVPDAQFGLRCGLLIEQAGKKLALPIEGCPPNFPGSVGPESGAP